MAKPLRPPFTAAERFLWFPRGCSAVFPASGGYDDDLAEAGVRSSEPGGPAPKEACRDEDIQVGRAPRRAVGGLSREFGDGSQVAASAPGEALFLDQAHHQQREEVEEDAKGVGGGWVPPHVYLARRQAQASVVEGAGRTLKGRDMSRVRDAVWSRTGFDG